MCLGYISHVIKKLCSANINRENFSVGLIFLFIHTETGKGGKLAMFLLNIFKCSTSGIILHIHIIHSFQWVLLYNLSELVLEDEDHWTQLSKHFINSQIHFNSNPKSLYSLSCGSVLSLSILLLKQVTSL